jgi:hypothetical protein
VIGSLRHRIIDSLINLFNDLEPRTEWPNALLMNADEAVLSSSGHSFEETRWESFEADMLRAIFRGNLHQVVGSVWVNLDGVNPASRLIPDLPELNGNSALLAHNELYRDRMWRRDEDLRIERAVDAERFIRNVGFRIR